MPEAPKLRHPGLGIPLPGTPHCPVRGTITVKTSRRGEWRRWQRACFGGRKSGVQVPPPRPVAHTASRVDGRAPYAPSENAPTSSEAGTGREKRYPWA